MAYSAREPVTEQNPAKGARVSIVALVSSLLERACELRASDIHIEPGESAVKVRLRIDGVLMDVHAFPKSIHEEVVSRIKILAGLRTDEHFSPQDGRFRHQMNEHEFIDLRVSIVPTYHGENAVLRLLEDKAPARTLADLGFSEEDCKKILNATKKQNGMILSTGPTGSGKTTTLYTLLKSLNSDAVSIVTIEDPIEYAISGVEQLQVNTRAGLTFGGGLRSILRQDPNIIMVGEIRDQETAGIAVNTALTGHLLLSTLHTSDAATTVPRLLDMGIDAYLVASTLNIAIGQRLVRKICKQCKEELVVNGEIFFKGEGCAQCAGSGYRGRVVISEVLVADEGVREAIARKASADELRQLAIQNGMTTMREDGLKKAHAGETSLEEVLRVIHD